jgi:hypothetical protein
MLSEQVNAILDLADYLGPKISGYTTKADGFKISVPGAGEMYAQTVVITQGNTVKYSAVAYSGKVILPAPKSAFEGAQTGCTAGGIA